MSDTSAPTAEQTVRRIVASNWMTNGVGTPKEEVVRQATGQGVTEEDASEAVESLRRKADIYETRPGLLVPVEKPGVLHT